MGDFSAGSTASVEPGDEAKAPTGTKLARNEIDAIRRFLNGLKRQADPAGEAAAAIRNVATAATLPSRRLTPARIRRFSGSMAGERSGDASAHDRAGLHRGNFMKHEEWRQCSGRDDRRRISVDLAASHDPP